MKLLSYFIVTLFSSVIMMCSSGDASASYEDMAESTDTGMMAKSIPAEQARESQLDQDAEIPDKVDERKLIKRGHFVYPVGDLQKAESWMRERVKAFDGYIASESENNYDYRREVNMELRIPSARFDDFSETLLDQYKHFDRKDINVQDVTAEFLDVEARIKTKKELEARYLDILKRAKNVTEILEVERELSSIRQEIESAEGRMKFLRNQTSYSTINVNMYREQTGPSVGFLNKLGQGFVNGWNGFLSVIVGLVTIWPFILLIGGLLWLLIRWSKRSNKRAASTQSKSVEEE